MSTKNLREIDICSKLLHLNFTQMKSNPRTVPNTELMWRRGHAYLKESIDTTTRPWGTVKNSVLFEKAMADFRAAHQIHYGFTKE